MAAAASQMTTIESEKKDGKTEVSAKSPENRSAASPEGVFEFQLVSHAKLLRPMGRVETFADQLPEGVECYYVENFFSKAEADSLFQEIHRDYPWAQEQSHVFGKDHDQPRLTRFMADGGEYVYSGFIRPSVPWIPSVAKIRDKATKIAQSLRSGHAAFNVVLGNLYRDGRDYIGRHSDAETVHEGDSMIASISLGAERDFDIRDKKTKKLVLRVKLPHGSLFLMGRNFQQMLTHELPKRLKIKDPRINLTFRRFEQK
jgi:alkylated DNA repair dioxygenase AlkB